MINAFTIDVEDYHNILARDWLDRDGPPTGAVVHNTHRLLDLLAAHETRATFFLLGEVAEHHPQLIRDIAAAGHEVGVHGYYHRQLFKLTPDTFRREIRDAKARIEDLAGAPCLGHRAPAFSIRQDTQWGLDVLADAGFRYDSSIYPIRGRRYGWAGFPKHIHEMTTPNGRRIIEAPPATVTLFGVDLPACGGGYLRHFPYAVTRAFMRRIQRARPAIVYIHPYEIETTDRPLDTAGLSRERAARALRFNRSQLRNRHTVGAKLERLLTEFEFAPLRDVIQQALGDRAFLASSKSATPETGS
jgi:polysaccharide deacetylase family protein (PEP-CTERM system associated)